MLIKKEDILLFIASVLLGVMALFSSNSSLCLIVAVIQMILIFKKATISFFSIIAVPINFCLYQEYVAYNGGEVYGLLNFKNVPIYYFELFICVFSFNLIIYLFIYFSKCLEWEKRLFSFSTGVNYTLSVILCMCAVVITLLIFPSVPNLKSGITRTWSGILPFSGWSVIPFFFLATALQNLKCRKAAIVSMVFVISWYVLHGERVEPLGLLCLICIAFCYKDKRNLKPALLFLMSVVVLFIIVGMSRGGVKNYTVSSVLNSVLIQSTACDVTYIFNCAVDVLKKGICFYGITYLSYLFNCIPLLQDSHSFQMYIQNFYPTAGGGLFFAEPIANFGILFTIFFTFFFFLIIVLLMRKPCRYTYMIYATLCTSVFRIAWYGLNYPQITILYFVPFVLFADYLMRKARKSGPTV